MRSRNHTNSNGTTLSGDLTGHHMRLTDLVTLVSSLDRNDKELSQNDSATNSRNQNQFQFQISNPKNSFVLSISQKMSGHGKGGKGLGKGGAKRHCKVLHDNIQGITKPTIHRLAREGGVKRINDLIYEETRGVLKIFLENVMP